LIHELPPVYAVNNYAVERYEPDDPTLLATLVYFNAFDNALRERGASIPREVSRPRVKASRKQTTAAIEQE
jgi:hypothetical protein